MITESYKELTVVSGGGTDNIDLTLPYREYYILTSGAVTLTSNYTIQGSGTPAKGMKASFFYRANLDFDGNTMTIFGSTVPATWDNKQWRADVYYNGSAWEVKFYLDAEETDVLDGDFIVDATIDGGKLTTATVNGDRLVDGTVSADKFDSSVGVLKVSTTVITPAEVLTAFTTPVQLVPAVAGKILNPVAMYFKMTGHTGGYATNTTIQIETDTANTVIGELDCLGLNAGTNPQYYIPFVSAGGGPTNSQLITNKDLQFTVKTGNPVTSGGTDGTVTITILYYEQ